MMRDDSKIKYKILTLLDNCVIAQSTITKIK